MTLDVIGLAGTLNLKRCFSCNWIHSHFAGFNYDFDAIQTKGRPNELNMAFKELSSSPPSGLSVIEWLRRTSPFVNKIYVGVSFRRELVEYISSS